MPDITAVPAFTPDDIEVGHVDLPDIENPWNLLWWTAQSVTGVPETVMGWLVGQGWTVTAVIPDTTTTPPTMTYSLAKPTLSPQNVLLNLCNNYTIAANEARQANQIRYNDIINDWKDMITTSQTQFDAQAAEQNAQAGVYFTDMGTFMAEIDDLIDANASEMDRVLDTATAALNEMDDKLAELETNANNNNDTSEGLLINQADYLSEFIDELAAKMGELDTNYSVHLDLMNALIAQSDTNLRTLIAAHRNELGDLTEYYDAHKLNAQGYLTNLGTTELNRINEEFAASLSVQTQKLITDGLYTSAVAADIAARNTRDKDEQIQLLNDRLNREQLENSHKLYGQQIDVLSRNIDEANRRHQMSQAVTQWKATQLDRLLEQLQQIETQQVAAIDREHAAQQDVSRVALSQRDSLLAQLQDSVKGILAGKERYAGQLAQHASIRAEQRHRAIAEKMNKAVAQLDGFKSVSAENRQLMAYQLDERNKLLVGLYSFVERRDDVAPEWKDMASMIAGLGDAGGGWITP